MGSVASAKTESKLAIFRFKPRLAKLSSQAVRVSIVKPVERKTKLRDYPHPESTSRVRYYAARSHLATAVPPSICSTSCYCMCSRTAHCYASVTTMTHMTQEHAYVGPPDIQLAKQTSSAKKVPFDHRLSDPVGWVANIMRT